MEWSNDVTLEFLKLYENEPTIWNPKHPLNKNRNDMNDAWIRIGESISIECSVKDLKRKKDSLMASFRLLYNKAQESLSKPGGTVYKPSWFAYDAMERFLKDVYQPKITSKTEDLDASSALVEEYQPNENEDTELVKEKFGERKIGRGNIGIPSSGISLPPEKTFKSPPKQQMFHKRKGRALLYGIEKRMAVANHEKRPVVGQSSKDVCSLYGELLARKLRGLNDKTRDIVMNEIDNLVFRAKMDQGYQLPHVQSFPSYSVQPYVVYPSTAHTYHPPMRQQFSQHLAGMPGHPSGSFPQFSPGPSSFSQHSPARSSDSQPSPVNSSTSQPSPPSSPQLGLPLTPSQGQKVQIASKNVSKSSQVQVSSETSARQLSVLSTNNST